jgi:CheY-like chemotaxis protein
MATRPVSRALTVLVVEDDSDVRESIQMMLEHDGFSTLAATDGAHGLALLAAHQPDVVLLDMHLPVLDGTEFLRHKARMSALAPIPVIAITGHPTEGIPQGAASLLRKPFDVEEFRTAFRLATRARSVG